MGASESTAAEPDTPEAARFSAAELAALRRAYAVLVPPGEPGIPRANFELLSPGIRWSSLFTLMSVLDEPSVVGVVHWRGFLAGVAAVCKSRTRERASAIARMYLAGHGPAATDDARRLLSDALVASRGGEGADGAADAEFGGPIGDALLAAASDGASQPLTPELFAGWVLEQIPALSSCLERFTLETLCALGDAAAGSRGGAGSSADALLRAALAAARALPRAISPFAEPVLHAAAGRPASAPPLLDTTDAWLISLAMGPAAAGEAREWRCLYDSTAHGLALNRFVHSAVDYRGPTVLLVRTDANETLGCHVDSAWRAGDGYFGGRDSFIIELAPKFHVYRPTGIGHNYAYFNPPQTGALKASTYLSASSAAPEGIGFGGQLARMRLGVTDDLGVATWHNMDTTYLSHPQLAGRLKDGERKVVAIELWGCGGVAAEAAQKALREQRARDAHKAGKVDRAAFFKSSGDDWRGDNPDKMILEAAGAHTFYSSNLDLKEPMPQ